MIFLSEFYMLQQLSVHNKLLRVRARAHSVHVSANIIPHVLLLKSYFDFCSGKKLRKILINHSGGTIDELMPHYVTKRQLLCNDDRLSILSIM